MRRHYVGNSGAQKARKNRPRQGAFHRFSAENRGNLRNGWSNFINEKPRARLERGAYFVMQA
jgi:hypothetical protein